MEDILKLAREREIITGIFTLGVSWLICLILKDSIYGVENRTQTLAEIIYNKKLEHLTPFKYNSMANKWAAILARDKGVSDTYSGILERFSVMRNYK